MKKLHQILAGVALSSLMLSTPTFALHHKTKAIEPHAFHVNHGNPNIPARTDLNKPLFVKFAPNSAAIHPKYHAALKNAGIYLRSHPRSEMMVVGHTDSDGNAAHNKKLAHKRAKSIKSHLIKHFDIHPNRISTFAKGEHQPVASNKHEAGKQLNRRAVTFIHNRDTSPR